jgi:hypothetical protein
VHWVAAAGLVFAGACGRRQADPDAGQLHREHRGTRDDLVAATRRRPPRPRRPRADHQLGAAPPELDMPKLTDASTVTTAGIGRSPSA